MNLYIYIFYVPTRRVGFYFVFNHKVTNFCGASKLSYFVFEADLLFYVVYSSSHSFSHEAALASLGIRQSPRGLSDTDPTLGPSGRQERLNCC